MRSKITNAVLLLAFVVGGVFLYNKYRIAPKVKFAELHVTDLTGRKVELSSYNKGLLFVNFFATWCPPCVAELPSLELASEKLKDRTSFVIVSDEPIERLLSFQERNKYNLTFLHSETRLREIDIYTIPTSYLLNSKGEILLKHVGEEDWASEEWLAKIRE